mgnify:CR=1 FL=1
MINVVVTPIVPAVDTIEVEIETDLYEKIYLKNYEADPLGTSAAVLRDILELVGAKG